MTLHVAYQILGPFYNELMNPDAGSGRQTLADPDPELLRPSGVLTAPYCPLEFYLSKK